ncbi:MAG: hypothetical protein KDK12_17760 [Rhodobacteraceae bacterium]|nr:hypothetical protein [Paracoccaceae bacterium]
MLTRRDWLTIARLALPASLLASPLAALFTRPAAAQRLQSNPPRGLPTALAQEDLARLEEQTRSAYLRARTQAQFIRGWDSRDESMEIDALIRNGAPEGPSYRLVRDADIPAAARPQELDLSVSAACESRALRSCTLTLRWSLPHTTPTR